MASKMTLIYWCSSVVNCKKNCRDADSCKLKQNEVILRFTNS